MKPDIILIDHYDSFTANLKDWLELEFRVTSYQFDELPLFIPNVPLVFSPGPKSPNEAPQSCDLVHEKYRKVPILGVCLGHQILGACFGSRIERSQNPVHGEVKELRISSESAQDPFVRGLSYPFYGASYHSLIVKDLPLGWQEVACCGAGELQIMKSAGPGAPAYGVQFHPESFMTGQGSVLLKNWKTIIVQWLSAQA